MPGREDYPEEEQDGDVDDGQVLDLLAAWEKARLARDFGKTPH